MVVNVGQSSHRHGSLKNAENAIKIRKRLLKILGHTNEEGRVGEFNTHMNTSGTEGNGKRMA